MKVITKRLFILLAISIFFSGGNNLWAQEGAPTRYEEPINISRSPDKVSTDPLLIADKSGRVHLFWAEKTLDDASRVPDTIMYAAWDGKAWSEPVDIFFSPLGHTIHALAPQGFIDDEGYIHLIWMAESNFPDWTLWYSRAHASQANNAGAWVQPPLALANDLSGTNFSVDIAQDEAGRIHAIFARVRQGAITPEPRAVSYVRSDDGGETWTESFDIYTIPERTNGASNTQIITDGENNVYTSWSEWNETGNGQRIYFARSLDGGEKWEEPRLLTQRISDEYERDWGNLVLLGENHIASVWEGGYRAYRHAMYSTDAGATWTKPVDIFPGLIGENGYSLFADDSDGRIHLFVAQRIREGNPRGHIGGLGLWQAVYNDDQSWTRPRLAGAPYPMINPSVAIVNGNEVVAAWYSGTHYEIMVMTGEILDAPPLNPEELPAPTMEPTPTPSPEPEAADEIPEAAQPVIQFSGPPPATPASPGMPLIFGIIPALIFMIFAILSFQLIRDRRN